MKKYLFASFAIALAVAFSAFTVPAKSTSQVWVYDGVNDISQVSSWTQGGSQTPCSEDAGILCKVEFTSATQTFEQFLSGKDQEDILAATEEITLPTFQPE